MSEDTTLVVPTARNDWGQRETRELFLQFVDRAPNHGITSFFLDKASVSAREDGQICNHKEGDTRQEDAKDQKSTLIYNRIRYDH